MTLLVLILCFICLVFLGFPYAFATLIPSMISFLAFKVAPPFVVFQRMFTSIDSFPILAVPMFILAGLLMNEIGVTERIMRLSDALVGWIRGSLAHVNVVASMLFAGISGSAVADSAGLGAMLIPAMVKNGYDEDFSAAVTAASSVVGPIIPPSITVIIYCLVDPRVSVGALFMAGVIPGILICLGLMVVAYLIARRRGYERGRWKGFKNLFRAVREGFGALLMPLIILGGILSGWFTPTEASTIAVAYGILLGFFAYRTLTFKGLVRCIAKAAVTSCTILFIMATAKVFSWLLSVEGAARVLVNAVQSLNIANPYLFLVLLMLIMLVFGCFIEGLAEIIILVPLFVPLFKAFGGAIHPLHFAELVIMVINISLLTPPLGLCLYTVTNICEKTRLEGVIKATVPFFLYEALLLIVLCFTPSVVTFLPRLLGLIK